MSVLLDMPIGLSPTYSFVLQVGGVAAALRTSLWRTFPLPKEPVHPMHAALEGGAPARESPAPKGHTHPPAKKTALSAAPVRPAPAGGARP